MSQHEETGPAAYYEAKGREARELAEQLRQAKERGAPIEEVQRLERRLEAAYYVGD